MHRLLKRQIKKHLGRDFDFDNLDEKQQAFFDAITDAYNHNETQRSFLEKALTVSTEELEEANKDIQEKNQILEELLDERSQLLEHQTKENEDMVNILHQYRKAMDASLMVSTTSVEGNLTYVNDNFCKITGYSKEELLGKPHTNLRHPDITEELYEEIVSTIQSKKIWQGIYPGLSKKGETFYVKATILPLLNTKGEITEFISLRDDVTKQIIYQKELKQHTKKVNTILNSQENIVVLSDIKKGIIEVNDRFYETFNFKNLKAFKKEHNNILELLKTEEENSFEEVEWFEKLSNSRDKLHKALYINNKNKEQIFSVNCHKIELNEKPHYLCTFIDVTELENARKKAEIAQKAKSIFLANMSHEIRTPLNAIIGFSELLHEEIINQEKKEHAKIISKSANSLLNIINDVLDISKVESGTIVLENEAIDLDGFNKEIVELFSIKAKQKEINFTYETDDHLPCCVYVDITRLRQVLSNLLSNAIKFTPQKGEVLFMALTKEINDHEVCIEFIIEDSGIGISKKKQSVIFEPFLQGDEGINKRFGGTGLGLAICKDILEIMNSEIKLESQLHAGSRFSFELCLPIKHQCSKIQVEDKKREDTMSLSYKDKKVLIAEDNPNNQALMEVILKKLDINCTVANDGIEAIEAYKNDEFDLVLMDVNMPILDGVEATKRLKEEQTQGLYKAPIIALTANSIQGDREKYLEAGMDDYLSKPINFRNLSAILDKYLLQEKPKKKAFVFNKKVLAEELMLDEPTVTMLLQNFFGSINKDLKELQEALDSKNSETIIQKAHYIKSAASNLGMKEVSSILQEIENLANKEASFEYDLKKLKDILEKIRKEI